MKKIGMVLWLLAFQSLAGVTPECGQGPFLCPDGSCVEVAASECSHLTCPDPLPFMCEDGTCAESESHCRVSEEVCPVERPVRWSDGSCRLENYEPDCPHPGIWDGETCFGGGE